MVNITQFLARLTTFCLLWLIVRFTQYLLGCCDRRREADSVSMAELYLQVEIKQMLEGAATKILAAS